MTDSTRPWQRADVLSWILSIVLAAVFLMQGAAKFPESRLWIRVFDEIGFGQWFRYVTGVVEVLGALMLLVPRASLVGVGLLVCTMAGALLVHATIIGLGRQTVFVGILLLMLFTVGWTRIRQRCAAPSSPVGSARLHT